MGALSILGGQPPPDVAALVANGFILLAFIGTIIAGVVKGVKEWRVLRAPSTVKPGAIAAATIMENITLSEWSGSNREVKRSVDRLVEAVDDLRREMRDNAEELRDVRKVLEERRTADRHWLDQRPD